MDKKYLLTHSLRRAFWARFIAKMIDLALVLGLFFLLFPFGALLGIFYLSIADSLGTGQSLGKKLIGFGVTSLEDGSPCSLKQSFVRNLPFSVPMLLLITPVGWVLAPLLFIPMIGFEVYLLWHLDSGHRLGDVMADTTVIADDQHREDMRKKKMSWFEPQSPT